jgi:hypothetical protein
MDIADELRELAKFYIDNPYKVGHDPSVLTRGAAEIEKVREEIDRLQAKVDELTEHVCETCYHEHRADDAIPCVECDDRYEESDRWEPKGDSSMYMRR